MDDWFSNNFVLEKLNAIYTNENCWTTFGSCRSNDRPNVVMPSEGPPRTTLVNRKFRDNGWYYTHLKTFKSFLFQNIDVNDFKDKNTGDWIGYSYDRFLMYPILEMTPPEKIRYISDVLCTYNTSNPISVSKINKEKQSYYKNLASKYKRYNIIRGDVNENISGRKCEDTPSSTENAAVLDKIGQ
jgi:hypothetical protein